MLGKLAAMMSISEALNAAQTAAYFDDHYSQDEYYTQGQTCVGQWLGKGAAALGLAGEVEPGGFQRSIAGH